MKTLTAAAEAKRTATARGPRAVLEIDWARASTWTGKYADQALTIGDDTYEAYVLSWGGFRSSLDFKKLGSIDDLSVTFKMDATEAFSDILALYTPEGTPARLGLWFSGTAAADIEWLAYFEINQVQEIGIDGVKIDFVQSGQARLDQTLPEHDVNLTDFPDAPEDSIGKRVPVIYGDVERVPAICVSSGAATELYGSHSPGDETIRVYSVEDFPASGTIIIDDEEITYTALDPAYSWLGETVAAFTGCARHANSTEPDTHQHGAQVREKITSSVFVVADHACASVDRVRVGGQLADPDDVTVNKNDTTTLSGRTLTTLTFDGEPARLVDSEAVNELQIWPDAEGDDNACDDYALVIDEVEANTAAEVTTVNSPLEVQRTQSVSATSVSSSEQITVNQDAYVRSDMVSTNYGSETTLKIYRSNTPSPVMAWRAYISLDAANIPASFSAVSLFLRTTALANGEVINATQSAAIFDAAALTWTNQPNGTAQNPTGSVIDAVTITGADTWFEFELGGSVDLEKGIVIWQPWDGSGAEVDFHSVDAVSASLRPYFVFTTSTETETDIPSTPITQGGRLLEVHAAIEFSTSEQFDPGQLQFRVEKTGLSMDWQNLWAPQYGHQREAYDTLERHISQKVSEVVRDTTLPVHNVIFNQLENDNDTPTGYYVDTLPPAFAVDGNWETACRAVHSPSQLSGKTQFGVLTLQSTLTPPGGTVQQIRCKYRCGNGNGFVRPTWTILFYFNNVLRATVSAVSDGDRHYTAWVDLSGDALDMETTLTSSGCRIEAWLSTGGAVSDSEAYLYMAGIEVQYTPTGGGETTEGSTLTTTNFLDLVAAGAIDASAVDDPWGWFQDAHLCVRNVDYSGTFKVFSLFFFVKYLPIEKTIDYNVSCDVEGIEDAGDGSGTLIENPSLVIQHIMTGLLGFSAGDIDSTSFDAAETALDDRSAVFAFALLEARTAHEALAELAYQARSWLRLEGGSAGAWHFDMRPALLSGSVRTLGPTGVTARLPGTGKLSPLPLSAVSNRVIVLFDKDYSAIENRKSKIQNDFRQSRKAESAASQSDYGLREKTIEAWAVRSSAYAQNLADFILAQEAQRRQVYNLQTLVGNIDLERADIIACTDARLGMTAALGEIIGISYLPGSAPQKRPHTLDILAYLEPYEFANEDSVAQVLITGNAIYVIVSSVVVAKITSSALYLRGSVRVAQTLEAATANPLEWDSDNSRAKFSLSDNTCMMEFSSAGNLYLKGRVRHKQTLSFAGAANELNSNGSTLWLNLNSARIATVESDGDIFVPGTIIERAKETYLL